MTINSPEAFAYTHLSSGIHCLQFDGEWKTIHATDNLSNILGIPSPHLLDAPLLWIGRIHPDDVDVIRAALKSAQMSIEKGMSYRFRDSKDCYRWIGYRYMKRKDNTIIGVITDITRYRIREYSDRIHTAGRNALATILDTRNLNTSINEILEILGSVMVVDKVRFVRFRKDGRAFISHQWSRREEIERTVLPIQLSSDAVRWWKDQFSNQDTIAIANVNDKHFPESIDASFKDGKVGALIVVPILIYGALEGFTCLEVAGDRNWLQMEIEEAKLVFQKYSQLLEHQIEERKHADEEFQLRRSEQNYRLLTKHSPVVLFGIDTEGIFTLSEGLGLESMDAGSGEVVGQNVYQLYRNHPDVLEHVNKALSGIESHGTVHIGDKYFEVWFTPVHDDDNNVVGISGVTVDVTVRNKLEQQQTIMMRELDHRVKNNIAAVISLVGLSKQSAGSMEDFATTLDGRLHALSVAHSALAKSRWSGVWLRDILQLTLQPYMVETIGRIQFKGPDLELLGHLARPMCMVIHELATNAVKHGALSSKEGSVVITTEILKYGETLQLHWVEKGGPDLTNDYIQGTGISLLEGLVDHEMHGTIEMQFEKFGLVCKIVVPLTQDS